MTKLVTISDPLRVPITAEKREGGGVVLRRAYAALSLSSTELGRLIDFVDHAGDNLPKLGELQRFPMNLPVAGSNDRVQ